MADIQLQITFPISSEDHRLQLVEINSAIFALFFSSLESDGPILLNCEEWNVILLSPIKSKMDVTISGKNIIRFAAVESKTGSVNISASKRLVSFSSDIRSALEKIENGKKSVHQLYDDPAFFVQVYKQFQSIIEKVHEENLEETKEAQKIFLTALCSLAEKVTSKEKSLNLHRVLGIWDIPPSPL